MVAAHIQLNHTAARLCLHRGPVVAELATRPDPFDYPAALQQHAAQVANAAVRRMPWKYSESLAAAWRQRDV